MNNNILWISPELARVFPIVKPFEPVFTWDNENRRFTEKQEIKDNLPIWEGQALLPTGWNADLTPVRLRIAARSKPTFQPNLEALANLINVQDSVPSSPSLPSLSK